MNKILIAVFLIFVVIVTGCIRKVDETTKETVTQETDDTNLDTDISDNIDTPNLEEVTQADEDLNAEDIEGIEDNLENLDW